MKKKYLFCEKTCFFYYKPHNREFERARIDVNLRRLRLEKKGKRKDRRVTGGWDRSWERAELPKAPLS